MNAIRKSEKLTAKLRATTIDNQYDYDHYQKRVSAALRGLSALWSNPADVLEAARIQNELFDAWECALEAPENISTKSEEVT